jgi:hypothetical protein
MARSTPSTPSLSFQYSAGLVPTLPCLENADVNGDNQVNSLDAELILQYGAGDMQPPTPIPEYSLWSFECTVSSDVLGFGCKRGDATYASDSFASLSCVARLGYLDCVITGSRGESAPILCYPNVWSGSGYRGISCGQDVAYIMLFCTAGDQTTGFVLECAPQP